MVVYKPLTEAFSAEKKSNAIPLFLLENASFGARTGAQSSSDGLTTPINGYKHIIYNPSTVLNIFLTNIVPYQRK